MFSLQIGRRVAVGMACALFAALAFGVADARAAGLDCKKAATAVEKLICDAYLDGLDVQLAGAFDGALERSNTPDKVRAEQARWLKRRDACRDATCLEAAYRERIDMLMAVSDKPDSCDGMTTEGMNDCAAIYSDRAERELVRYVATARARLVESAEEDEGAREAVKGFDEAQKAWSTYRDAECGAVFNSWSGGTVRVVMNLSCMTAITKARTHQLWANWLRFVDSTPPLLPEPRPEPGAP
ncbi:lysozyme inhibitor LprI family protein [Phenylobacterium sp.]|uniref:lysozyme inhibitor LprI family protein n=1 Tax=Phenylobacterium sp. TaxID=1871053 RepID=UPI00391AECF5